MEAMKLASGDNNVNKLQMEEKKVSNEKVIEELDDQIAKKEELSPVTSDITIETIEDNETKLKTRIDQCKNIIDSLKFELNAEKAKLEMESKVQPLSNSNVYDTPMTPSFTTNYYEMSTSDNFLSDKSFDANRYSASVDNQLNYDENLMEYEKQLQKYQNTLNMAQLEKKNAIRKQMLAKAYRLKLLEVENQCNIELLRVKQSLQCLEPLQMIVNKWKTSTEDSVYDLDNYELMPRYPELGNTSIVDINSVKDDTEGKSEESIKNDAVSDC